MWEDRIAIPLTGNNTLEFLSQEGLLLAIGYVRVVIGQRGPYVEFDRSHIQWDAFKIPKGQEFRNESPRVYYIEYRSICSSKVKLYLQKRTVRYADYRIGYAYISPFDMKLSTRSCIHQKPQTIIDPEEFFKTS